MKISQLLLQGFNLASNMGARYIFFRSTYLLRKKTGLLKRAYPVNPPFTQFTTLQSWKQQDTRFFFDSREDLRFQKSPNHDLENKARSIMEGKLTYFNATEYDLGLNYDWVTNPGTGYSYDCNRHWTDINDYSRDNGDIKYVWEKSRFSYLHTMIRYDYHFGVDVANFVFSEILSWIAANPINQGPNYKCSQEISIRILNWTFALNYYKNSAALTTEVFDKIIFAIYWQVQHVYNNINFSRIAVRNNHAITETLCLYLCGVMFPFLPGASKWKRKGKGWFEKEIEYQVYPDGSFLQFSMNYHRVVIQLLTWAIVLSKQNNEKLNEIVTQRADKSLKFLLASMNYPTGELPNYGANDGALFFPLNDNHFRDFRPQLQALGLALGKSLSVNQFEDACWYGLETVDAKTIEVDTGIHNFETGGYYTLREANSLTFIRCGKHKDRPSQADNLHLDIWAEGENILRDGGSYLYNTDDRILRYFFGTASHNTIMLGNLDQMKKGSRFIWYYWSQAIGAKWEEYPDHYLFTGTISAFRHIAKDIRHQRIVKKYKGKHEWIVTDRINTLHGFPMNQLWHPAPGVVNRLSISAVDANGVTIPVSITEGMYSELYGKKDICPQFAFTTATDQITTTITYS